MNKTEHVIYKEYLLSSATSRFRSQGVSPSIPNYITTFFLIVIFNYQSTHTTARGHSNLYRVPSYLTDFL